MVSGDGLLAHFRGFDGKLTLECLFKTVSNTKDEQLFDQKSKVLKKEPSQLQLQGCTMNK